MYFLLGANSAIGLCYFLVSCSLLSVGALHLAYEVLDADQQKKHIIQKTNISLHSSDLELVRSKRDIHTNLKEPFYNALVAMHFQAAKKLNITNCWICTHSPISHKTIPLLGVPVSLAEFEKEANFGKVQAQYKNRSVSLLLASSEPMKTPAICINFTHIHPALSRPEVNATKKVGVTAQCEQAPLRYSIQGHNLTWVNNADYEFHNLSFRPRSKENHGRVLDCLLGYNFWKACAAPTGFYFICGKKAYSWIPVGATGTCYVGKIIPATWYVFEKDFHKNYKQIPKHYLYKRTLNSQDLAKTSTPIKPLFGIPWVNRCCTKMAFSFIIDLADLLDNITEQYDRYFRISDPELQMIKKDFIQQRLVLDYITASQGGICTVVGTACCNYISNDSKQENTLLQHIEKVKQLKEEFEKKHEEETRTSANWEWLNNLNPVNWFSSIGGWISGIFHGMLYVIGIGITLYVFIQVIRFVPKLGTCHRFSTPAGDMQNANTDQMVMTYLQIEQMPYTTEETDV